MIGWKVRCTIEGQALGAKSMNVKRAISAVRRALKSEGFDVIAVEMVRKQDLDLDPLPVAESRRKRF